MTERATPELVDFSVGLTDPSCFPVDELAALAPDAIREVGEGFSLYPGPLGHAGLRRVLAARESHREGREIDPDQIALANGSMQAVTLVGRALMEAPGDVIVTEELTYSGTINAYKGLGARLVGVPVDAHGMRVDVLAETLDRLETEGTPARFVYTLPTYQNPTGAIMPLERRQELLEVARRRDVVVVEDNCYGDVHFEGEVPPSLYSLDESPRIVYLCSLSKIFGAGLRIGYLMARPPMLERLTSVRFDAGHSLLSAAVAAKFLDGRLWQHVERHNQALKRKRDALVAALEETLAGTCRFTIPRGGLFLWLELPSETDLDELVRLAAERGVGFARGAAFHVAGADVKALRLAFGYPTVDEIGIGVRRLATCIDTVLAAGRGAVPVGS